MRWVVPRENIKSYPEKSLSILKLVLGLSGFVLLSFMGSLLKFEPVSWDLSIGKNMTLVFYMWVESIWNNEPRMPSSHVGCLRSISEERKFMEILFCDWPKPTYASRGHKSSMRWYWLGWVIQYSTVYNWLFILMLILFANCFIQRRARFCTSFSAGTFFAWFLLVRKSKTKGHSRKFRRKNDKIFELCLIY